MSPKVNHVENMSSEDSNRDAIEIAIDQLLTPDTYKFTSPQTEKVKKESEGEANPLKKN